MKTTNKLILTGSVFLAALAAAAPPAWWASRGVTNGAPVSDYAAANVGQLKNTATQAAAEMNAQWLSGAGASINNLVLSWQQPPAQGVTRSDYSAVNQGQLKNVAKL